jgi:hypothetical protein
VEQWFTSGKKGIVGLHAALVHQTNWPWLNALGGCDFNSDSDFTKAKVIGVAQRSSRCLSCDEGLGVRLSEFGKQSCADLWYC